MDIVEWRLNDCKDNISTRRGIKWFNWPPRGAAGWLADHPAEEESLRIERTGRDWKV